MYLIENICCFRLLVYYFIYVFTFIITCTVKKDKTQRNRNKGLDGFVHRPQVSPT